MGPFLGNCCGHWSTCWPSQVTSKTVRDAPLVHIVGALKGNGAVWVTRLNELERLGAPGENHPLHRQSIDNPKGQRWLVVIVRVVARSATSSSYDFYHFHTCPSLSTEQIFHSNPSVIFKRKQKRKLGCHAIGRSQQPAPLRRYQGTHHMRLGSFWPSALNISQFLPHLIAVACCSWCSCCCLRKIQAQT